MKNVTLSLDDRLLEIGRDYARQQGLSLNSLIRKLLEATVLPPQSDWMEECFALMDRANGNSRGKKWKRAELYDI